LYVPAESVYAVIEVKQKLNKEYIKYAGDKVSSVRKLKRTNKDIIHAGGKYKAKDPHKIIGGFVALDSDWKKPFGNNFKSALRQLSSEEQIDIGCSLNNGSFTINYDKNVKISYSSKETALNYFFIKLITKLQEVGTVCCIDFEKYLETIDGE
jgi:hypothetical protein